MFCRLKNGQPERLSRYRYVSQRAEIVRAFYDGIGKAAVIYPAALFTAFSLGLTNLGIIFYARDILCVSSGATGWLAGAWALTYTVGCLSLRPVLGRFRPRYLIVSSLLLMSLCTCGVLAAPSYGLVFGMFSLYGLSMSLFWSPLMAWLSDGLEGVSLGRSFARYNLMWCVGNILSPYVCGWLAGHSARYPIALGAAIFFMTAVFVWGAALALPNACGDAAPDHVAGTAQSSSVQETRLRFAAWVGLFAAFFGLGAVITAFPLAAKGSLQFSERVVGITFLLRSLFSAVAFVFIGRTVFWHFRSLPMLTGQVLTGACFLALAHVTGLVGVALLIGALGMLSSLSYSESVFHGASGASDRARRMAVHEACLSLGIVCGSVVGGLIHGRGGISNVYLVCAFVISVGIVIQSFLGAWAARSGLHPRDDTTTEDTP